MLQTLLHVGELSLPRSGGAGLAWRGDVEGEGATGWAVLQGEVAEWAEELREKPGELASLLLLAQVCYILNPKLGIQNPKSETRNP